MKRLTLLLTGLTGFALNTLFAGDAPRGSLLELHSCEVYAGPCVVNSEAPQEGRCMVRAWDFAGGTFNGLDLAGLKVAVLQLSADNLADTDSKSGKAVVYVPESATVAQRNALVAWLKSSQADFHPADLQIRAAKLEFTKSEKGYAFSAGNFVAIKTASLEQCVMGSCGETLWYQPRSATSLFTVAVNHGSSVNEPLLNFKWNDSGNRSIFLGRFGEQTASKGVYVSMTELCGSTKAVF
jgi:hypothetical protein